MNKHDKNDNRIRRAFGNQGMAPVRLIAFAMGLLLLLTGCTNLFQPVGWNLNNSLQKPTNLYTPLQGTWKVTAVQPIGDEQTSLPAFAVGDDLSIDKDLVGIKDLYTINPTYSAKYVNTASYLASRYISVPTLEGYTQDNIEVVMVRDEDAFWMDIMRLSDDAICFSYNSRMYYLTQADATVATDVVRQYREMYQAQTSTDEAGQEKRNLSILIGVKEKHTDYYGTEYDQYSTYLIREDTEADRPRVYLMDNLFVPRGDLGYYFLTYDILEKNPVSGVVRAQFAAYPTTANASETQNVLTDAQQRSISYVHDGVIAFDKVNYLSALEDKTKKSEIVQMDNIAADTPLTVQQIGGTDGLAELTNELTSNLTFLNISDVPTALNQVLDPTNVGVERSRTQWSFFSSLEIESGAKVHFQKFPLELIQQTPLVVTDALQVPWTRVTAKNSQANTAFTTPNKNHILISDDDEIQYYDLNGDNISYSTRLSIQMESDSAEIVMVEYGYDESASLWETEFLKHETKQPQVVYGTSSSDSMME